jgi:hypothetical protein
MDVRSIQRFPVHRALVVAAVLLVAQPGLGGSIRAAAAAPAPVLIGPLGSTSATEPLLSWHAVAGATSYRVQISPSTAFSTLAYDVGTSATAATPQVDLAPGTWFWRVNAKVGGSSGPWSASTFIKTARLVSAPTQLTPPDGATLDTSTEAPVLAWTAVSGASSYQIEFSTSASMADPFWANVSTTSFIADFATLGQPLYWHVRAVARNKVTSGPWSGIRWFETEFQRIPTVVSPADGASARDIDLEWTALAGVAAYELEITPGPIPDWSSHNTRQIVSTATRYQFEDANASIPATWVWRVRARDLHGNRGPWTIPRVVTRVLSSAPSLSAPASGSTVGENPTLSWSSVVRADFYQVDVSPNAAFDAGVATYYTTETTFDIPSSDVSPYVLVKGGTYHWRVRGIDNTTAQLFAMARPASPWSSSRTFVYDPAISTLLSPPNGATVQVPTLQWNPVNVIHTRVTIEDKDGTIVDRAMTFADTYTPAVHMDPADGPFSWYVERVAEPGDGSAVVAWKSATRTFNLTAITASAGTPTPLLPSASHSLITPLLTWTPVVGADHYNIFPYADFAHDTPPDAEPTAWNQQPLHYPAFTYALGNLDVRSYLYVIRAYDAGGNLLAHGPSATFVIDALDAPTITGPANCGGDGCPIHADSPRLSWDPVEGAIRYHAGSDSTSSWNPSVLTMGTSAVLPTDMTRGPFGAPRRWWVYACVEQRCGAAARAELELELPPVPLVSPASDTVVDGPQVTFHWQDLIDAATPGGYVGTHGSEAKLYRAGVVGLAYGEVDGVESTLLLPSGAYEWFVTGYVGNGAPTPDARIAFTVLDAGPTLTAPGNGASVPRTPTLAWEAAPYTERNEVEVFRGTSTDAADRVIEILTTTPSYTPIDELDAGTYTWRVRTWTNNALSDWSVRTFVISAGSAPNLVIPVDGLQTASTQPLFDWAAAAGAVAYRFESSSSPTFAIHYQDVVTGQTAWAPVAAYPSGRWYWRVATLGAGGAVLAYSASRQVLIDHVAPAAEAPRVKLPSLGSTVSTGAAASITVSWSGSDALTGPPTFDVGLRVDGGPLGTVATALSQTSFAKVLSPGHTYRFAVRARDGVGNTSTWAYGSTFELRRFNEGNAALSYGGGWKQTFATSFVGGGARYATAAGAVATFTFTGRQVAWITSLGPSRGKAKVYIDGTLRATIDLHAPAIRARRVVFSRFWSASGPHKVRIVVSGTPAHARIDIDALLVVK